MARGRTSIARPVLLTEEPGAATAVGSLSVAIRAVVRPDLDALRAEIETLRAQLEAGARAPSNERLTINEAAAALHCSTRNVRRLIATGRLRATKVANAGSSRLLITKRSVAALLEDGT